MISALSAVSTAMISVPSQGSAGERKATLLALGSWALAAGHSALVSAVILAIEREGLRHAQS
jgi:hypothetical protein